jgi:hypothetical protein
MKPRVFNPTTGYQGFDAMELVRFIQPPYYRVEAEKIREGARYVNQVPESCLHKP